MSVSSVIGQIAAYVGGSYVNELVVMCSRHYTTVADPALADPAELRRRSRHLIGGTASCDQPHFLGALDFVLNKQASAPPSVLIN